MNILITGGSSGIGLSLIQLLTEAGHSVISASRNSVSTFKNTNVKGIFLDLANPESIKECCNHILDTQDHLDVVINNAGILSDVYSLIDSVEKHFAINHLGHYSFIGLLYPLLLRSNSRIVTVSSNLHGLVDTVDLEVVLGKKTLPALKLYGQSKLANLLFAFELNRQSPLLSLAVHPGGSKTDLFSGAISNQLKIINWISGFFGTPARIGASYLQYAATHELYGGEYIGPSILNLFGSPKIILPNESAHDIRLAKTIWDFSEDMTNIVYKTS